MQPSLQTWKPFHFGTTNPEACEYQLPLTPDTLLVLYKRDENSWYVLCNHHDFQMDAPVRKDCHNDLKELQREAVYMFRQLVRVRHEKSASLLAVLDPFFY